MYKRSLFYAVGASLSLAVTVLLIRHDWRNSVTPIGYGNSVSIPQPEDIELNDESIERSPLSSAQGEVSRNPLDSPAEIEVSRGSRSTALPSEPRLAALPNIPGLEVDGCRENLDGMVVCVNGAPLLASQKDDPSWARPMEARNMEELPRQLPNGVGLSQYFVVCRATACGAVLAGGTVIDVHVIAERLSKLLGFLNSSAYVSSSEEFGAIWLTSFSDTVFLESERPGLRTAVQIQ